MSQPLAHSTNTTEEAVTYTSGTAVELTGITYRQLDYWTAKGYLRPAHEGGSGHSRLWSLDELNIMARMVRLVGHGLTPALAEQVARTGRRAEGPYASWSFGGIEITLRPWEPVKPLDGAR